MNYVIKVKTDGDEYVHVKIHKPLPHTNKSPGVIEATSGHKVDTPLL